MAPRSLLSLLLYASSFTLLHAQRDTLRLDTVSITATRIPGTLERVGRHVQVVDQRMLHGAVRPEVSELLRDHTAIDVRQRGPFDAQTDLSIRGGTYDQALVLIDGIPMSDPQTGHHLMDLPLLGDALERIDVCYGGASRTFGAGAFSGAVNLITRRPTGKGGSLTVDGGEFGSWRVRGNQEWVHNGLGMRLTAFHGTTNGAVANSDHEQSGAHVSAGKQWKSVELRGQAGLSSKRFGAQNFYSSLYPDQQEYTRTVLAAVELKHRGLWSWSVRSYFRQHNDRFELFREGEGYYRYANGFFIRGEADTARFTPTFFYTFHNVHRTQVFGAEAEIHRAWKVGTTALGIHARDEGILSNVLGEPLGSPITASGSRDPYTRRDGRRNLAIHLDHRYTWKRLTIDAGALLNLNTVFAPEWLPGVDLSYTWSERHTTYGSLSRAFRLPTYTDLYYNRGGAVGSLDLLPEHGDQAEIGHRFRRGAWSLSACAFLRRGRDLIDWVKRPGENTVRAANITAMDLHGLEFSTRWRSADDRTLIGGIYAYQWTDRSEFDFTSLYVLDQLRHRLSLMGEHRLGAFTARLNVLWQQRVGTYIDFNEGIAMTYPDHPRVDARVSWTRGPVQLFISGYNLMNSPQMDRANVPLPGRWLTGGVTLEWNKAKN
ncbi:MAG TPA: TonB-dependent receptor [Flavobacteriales bacterium]|nr:TonB-dependent receptor [Flavobacteriales bacterium]